MDDRIEVALRVNGRDAEVSIAPRTTLADLLRDELGLTGTHVGCEQGVCGSCTVLVDRRATRSCLMFAAQAGGTSVTTVEGLAGVGSFSALQRAFAAHDALQCGFCTPGFLMTATELLEMEGLASEDIERLLSGNLCRCTGYVGIIDACREVYEALHDK